MTTHEYNQLITRVELRHGIDRTQRTHTHRLFLVPPYQPQPLPLPQITPGALARRLSAWLGLAAVDILGLWLMAQALGWAWHRVGTLVWQQLLGGGLSQ
jgi:hypothetical protein